MVDTAEKRVAGMKYATHTSRPLTWPVGVEVSLVRMTPACIAACWCSPPCIGSRQPYFDAAQVKITGVYPPGAGNWTKRG